MKERPIIFSTEMVKAILAGRKTQTRRIIKPEWLRCLDPEDDPEAVLWQSPFQIGDLLWVRENGWIHNRYQPGYHLSIGGNLFFQADQLNGFKHKGWVKEHYKFFPSIHMPKAAARIWLQITDIKVEQLQHISKEDAIAEGIGITDTHKEFVLYKNYSTPGADLTTPQISFMTLWESINGKDSWAANPWVWAITFKVLSTTGKPAFAKATADKEVSHV